MSDSNDLLRILNGGQKKKKKRTEMLKPPFSQPGSKLKSLKHLLEYVPYKRGYIEVFGGTGALLLNRERCKLECFNDVNSGVTDFYLCLQNPKDKADLKEKIESAIHSREMWEWGKNWETENDRVTRAFRWYYMVRYSFGQMGRNFGRTCNGVNLDSPKLYNNIPFFDTLHRRLQGVLIENQDWRSILRDFDSPDHVFYLDPPYYGAANTSAYQGHSMPDKDHFELLETVFKMKATVCMSGYSSKFYEDMPWDKRYEWEAIEHLNSQFVEGDIRQKRTEVLWIKE